MKKTRGLAYLLGILLFGLAGGSLVQAAEIEITADFRPAVTDKNHNTFRNTTPLDKKAICIQWPHFCHNKEAFSIALPFAPIQQRKTLLVGDASRQGVYFKWPSKARKIEVIKVNQSGNQSKTVTFRVAAFGATLKGITRNIYDWYSVSGNTRFHMPEPPCGYMRIAVGYHEFITFLWETTLSDDVCVRRSLDERPAGSHYFEDFGIMYELKTPDPLAMGSGIYEGEKNFYIGEGQDIDFGDNFKT